MDTALREELLYKAKVAEQAELFEEMAQEMRKVVTANPSLTTEERNLLSVAYKNTIGSRRTALRGFSQIEKRERQKGSKNIDILIKERSKVEGELHMLCKDVL